MSLASYVLKRANYYLFGFIKVFISLYSAKTCTTSLLPRRGARESAAYFTAALPAFSKDLQWSSSPFQNAPVFFFLPASLDWRTQAAPHWGLLLISLIDADDSIGAERKLDAMPAAPPAFFFPSNNNFSALWNVTQLAEPLISALHPPIDHHIWARFTFHFLSLPHLGPITTESSKVLLHHF